MSLTGYPFTSCVPLLTNTGYSFAIGTLADASIYCDAATRIPVFTSVHKSGRDMTFFVGDYSATFDLSVFREVIEFYTPAGVFGGIFVLNQQRLRFLDSWRDGTHTFTNPQAFCPRCLEFVPPVGVQRIVTDAGDILSGEVIISGGYGTVLELLASPAEVTYIEVNFVGDPTYTPRTPAIPIQQIVCSDTFGTEIILTGDESRNVSIVASNFYEGNLFNDALRVEGFDNTVRVSLGGK